MRLSVAIPDSALSDETTKLDKTRKISILARACAIFGVESIYIYRDGDNREDSSLLMTILRYLETPQFLRRRVFPKANELKFAGVLQPLKIPSHTIPSDPKKIKDGDTRDGIVTIIKGKKFVDTGIDYLIPYFGRMQAGKRVTLRFKKGYPSFTIKEIPKEEAPSYWGYDVKERASLASLLHEWKGKTIITSRKGKNVTKDHIAKYVVQDQPTLVVFGSPERGVDEIMGNKMKHVQNAKALNFFADQATQTVRLEEALLGTLAIINAYSTPDHTVHNA